MSATSRIPGKSLGMFSLIMINVIAVDSLRSLTAGAEFGLALIFFYLLGAVLFFIPTILVTAELATGWPNTGGVYVWVREAFGPKIGFMTIWLQWIYNVVWYPTIFAFMAGILAYLVDPALTNNKVYMLSVILIAFWGTTLLNCLGLKVSSWVTALGAIFGTLLPMIFIAALGFSWLFLGKPSQLTLSVRNFFPNMSSLANLAFFTNILFGLMGMEMSAVHAGDVRNPAKNYPKALLVSGTVILVTLIVAALAIAIVIPAKQLNLVSGLMDAFNIFFKSYGIAWFTPIIAVLIILGSFAGAAVWIIGPARGLFVASKDNRLPQFMGKLNKKSMPVGILLAQGVIVTILCTVFLVMPSVNSSYWVLANLTAQLALLFYILMFAAAIRLRLKYPDIKRAYRIPGGIVGMVIIGSIGMLTCLGVIVLGFLPPSQVAVGRAISYEAILVGGIIICCMLPFLWKRRKYT